MDGALPFWRRCFLRRPWLTLFQFALCFSIFRFQEDVAFNWWSLRWKAFLFSVFGLEGRDVS
jgi:hypothetical protein